MSLVKKIIPASPLDLAIENSTHVWLSDLQLLFDCAKDRFPDVLWEITGPKRRKGINLRADVSRKVPAEIWGHRAIIQVREPNILAKWHPEKQSLVPFSNTFDSTSTLVGSISTSVLPEADDSQKKIELPLHRVSSLQMHGYTNYKKVLERVYTGIHAPNAYPDSAEISALRMDLLHMWRLELHADIRLELTVLGDKKIKSHTVLFLCHAFILVSRSRFFLDNLQAGSVSPGNVSTFHLSSPALTPTSLRFVLEYIYAGALTFLRHEYNALTFFEVYRAANYLSLHPLKAEMEARILEKTLHGSFNTFRPIFHLKMPSNKATGDKLEDGMSCTCPKCVRRIPRVLNFSLEDDIKHMGIESIAQRALVCIFGKGWCTKEFSELPKYVRELAVKGVQKYVEPNSAFNLLCLAESALQELALHDIESWTAAVKEAIIAVRSTVDELLCRETNICFAGNQWKEILQYARNNQEGRETRAKWVMAALMRGIRKIDSSMVHIDVIHKLLSDITHEGPNLNDENDTDDAMSIPRGLSKFNRLVANTIQEMEAIKQALVPCEVMSNQFEGAVTSLLASESRKETTESSTKNLDAANMFGDAISLQSRSTSSQAQSVYYDCADDPTKESGSLTPTLSSPTTLQLAEQTIRRSLTPTNFDLTQSFERPGSPGPTIWSNDSTTSFCSFYSAYSTEINRIPSPLESTEEVYYNSTAAALAQMSLYSYDSSGTITTNYGTAFYARELSSTSSIAS